MIILRYYLFAFIMIGLFFSLSASSLVTYTVNDYNVNNTDNNTISTDANVVLDFSSGTTLYSTGYYLSRIFDFGSDTNIYSFFWHEDYNYGSPLPDNQSYDNDINMYGNIALYHLDENLEDNEKQCYTGSYLIDGDMERSDVNWWTVYLTATLTKETVDPYEGTNNLKITCSGATCGAYQSVGTGYYYNITGKARGDGTRVPKLSGTGPDIWTGTSSTSWQNIDVNWTSDGALYLWQNTGIGYVEFDDIKVRKLGTSNCVEDSSGNNKSGDLDKYYLYAGSQWGSEGECIIGSCLKFDKDVDNIQAADNDNWSFTDGAGTDKSFTYEGWVYFNSPSPYSEYERWIINKYQPSAIEWRLRRLSTLKLNFNMYSQNTSSVYIGKSSSINLNNNTWYHIAVTYDGSETSAGIKYYINGVEDTSATTNDLGSYVGMNNTVATLKLGTYSLNTTNGRQDEVRLWKEKVLSATDINDIYNSENLGLRYDINRTNLVLDLLLDEGTGRTYDNNGLSPDLTNGASAGTTTGIRPRSITGKINNGYYFDGYDTRVTLGKLLGTDTNITEFTFSEWIYPLDLTAGRRILSKYVGTGTVAGSIQLDIASTNTVRFLTYNPSASAESVTANNNALTTNQWQLLTLTYKNGNVKIYVNGILNKDANLATTYISAYNYSWYLGEDGTLPVTANQPFNGYMDEAALWNRELSQSEINNIYRRQASDMNLQIRSCNDSGCDGEEFVGEDNTSATSYQYGNTIYNPSLSNNRFFQYKTIFSTIDTNSLITPSPKLYDVNFQYYNFVPEIEITDINGNSDSINIPNFSYIRDSNQGILRIDFNVFDPNNDTLTVDLNYSLSNTMGTGTEIVNDFVLDLNYCDDLNYQDYTNCYFDWNIYNVPDGNYYILSQISDSYDINENISDNYFMIDNTSAIVTADYNTPAFDGNVILSCSDSYSGCDKYYYQIDTNASDYNNLEAWVEVNGDTNTIISYYEDGNYQINFYSIDNTGNQEEINTIYFRIVSPALNVKTYNSDNNIQSYFGLDDSVKIIAEFENNYISQHNINIIDDDGTESVSSIMNYLDNNKFYFDLILDSDLNYGWIDVNIDGYVFEDIFYFSKTWQDNHTSLLGNIFPFKLDFNVSNNNDFERNLDVVLIDVNFDYRCAENSIRIIKCKDANCENDINNLIELPSQIYDIEYSGDYVDNASITFLDSFNENQTNYYYVVYSIRDINVTYYSDLNSYSDTNKVYFENSKYLTSLDLNSGALLGQLMQKSIVSDYNYNNSIPTTNVLLQRLVYTDYISLVSNVTSNLDINGILLKKYSVNGNSDLYNISYYLDYTFYANKPYFKIDFNFDPEYTLNTVRYTDFYLEVTSNIFTKFSRFGNNALNETNVNKFGDGANITDVNIDYFAFSDINRHLGFGSLFTSNPEQYNKTSFYDDADYESISREFYSGDINTNNLFSSTYYFVFFDSFIGIRDVNQIYLELTNPLSYILGTTNTFDSGPPVISDLNYSPYLSVTDKNIVTLTANISDALEIDTVTINVLGPDTNLIYSVNVNDMNYALSYDFNVNAGDYNCIIDAYDIANNNSATQYIEFNVIDLTSPVINTISLNHDTNNLIDPDTNLIFNVNLIEYTGINDLDGVQLYLEYYDLNNIIESSEIDQMGCTEPDYITDFDVNCSLEIQLDENEHIITYQIFANDDLNFDSNTDVETIYSMWEYSWIQDNNFSDQISGVLDNNIYVGDINIENTGDKNLTFKLTSNWDSKSQIFYDNTIESYDGYIFNVDVSEIKTIPVIVKAKSNEMDITTTFTIVNYDSEYGSRYSPDSNSLLTIISSITSGPHAYLEFRDKDISLVQGNTDVLYSAYIKNDGNESCSSAYVSWSLPSGVTISSNIDRNDFVFVDNNSFIDSIYVDVSSSAELGEKIISLTQGCRDNNYSRTISLDVVISDIYGNTSGGRTNTNISSGGGGSSKEKVPKYVEDNLFNLEQKSKLFETKNEFQIVRGKDTFFIINVSNPFDDVNIVDITITTTGLFTKYFSINPLVIDNISPNKSKPVIVTITAPKYFEEGTNNLEFVISGKVSGSVIEEDSNVKYIGFVENRAVLLKVFDIAPEDAKIYLSNAEQIIIDLNKSGFYVGKLQNKLTLAELDYSNEKYNSVKQILFDIKQSQEIAGYVQSKLSELNEKLEDAKSKEIKVTETEKLLVFASSAMGRGEFASAKSLVDQAEMTFALEIKGEVNFVYLLKTYWYDFLLGLIALIILIVIIIILTKRFRLKSRLLRLKDEEKILLFLIKDIQNKCFKDNKISMDDYKTMMLSYEDRYNKLLEEQIQINYNLKYFRKTEKALNSEKNELTKILEKLQKSYFYDNAIESRTYYIKFKSITERIGDIEADLANKEFKREFKKFKYKGDK